MSLDGYMMNDSSFYAPWVGSNWEEIEFPLMLLGEDPFLNHRTTITGESDWCGMKSLIIDLVNSKKTLGRSFGLLHIKKLYEALFGISEIDAQKFWHHIAFSSISQVFPKRVFGKLPKSDYVQGWKANLDLLESLRPSQCLVLGTRTQTAFIKAVDEKGWSIVEDHFSQRKISSCWPRIYKIEKRDLSNLTRVIFIGRISHSFNSKQWHAYLNDELNIKILKSVVIK